MRSLILGVGETQKQASRCIKDQTAMPSIVLSHKSFPFLTRAGGYTSLKWDHGHLYNILLSSTILRVSERGVSWCTTCDLATDGFRLGGVRPRIDCLPRYDTMCTVPGNFSGIRLFPSSQVDIPADMDALLAPQASTELGLLWTAVADGCQGKQSSRTLVFGDFEYDVSLCDLVHSKLEFVFYPQQRQLTWRHRDGVFNSLLWTVLVTIAVLFLFTRVCSNLSNIIRGQARTFDWYSTIVTLLAVCASFAACLENDFSTEENILTLGLQLYTLLCTLLLVGPRAWTHISLYTHRISAANSSLPTEEHRLLELSPVPRADIGKADTSQADVNVHTTGALTTMLLVLTAHLQNTYDTPFLNIFVVIFGSRSFLKFLNLALLHTKHAKSSYFCYFKFLVFCIDTLVFASVLELAVRTSASSESEYTSTATALLLVSVLAGVFLYTVVDSRFNSHRR